ncbi:uncharacterized protein TRIVIDRAFT_216472 [Trichoderma virens Gv29-8]|uniref:Uncharacterized protein n=1 Tax=Hypocrea virens (strain Gv29-8 / FGSC 10586) TaxID=413071 RepID=G9N0D1_HYPVG|nr:uncharacterized protein TRIVIDRAFT_216472 [Trichoderma virens Gv29-8]EHK19813.1 hypothetical protein TRIVIDRAFT_216472 [Trichoderma virens Gv29-8]UKZ53202.1 hypothetical protein TrVGV298_006994 [Trichoderma virens]
MSDASTYLSVGAGVVGTAATVAGTVYSYKAYKHSKSSNSGTAQAVPLERVTISDQPSPPLVVQSEAVRRVQTGLSSASSASFSTARTR